MKNDVYIVYEKKNIISTYQLMKEDGSLYFRKLAILPRESGKGVGSFCMKQIEKTARNEG